MKIALIRQRHTSYGGAEQYVSQLARLLVEGNHEVHLLARHWEGEALEGLHWHRLPPGFGPRFLRLAAFARDVARVVDQIDFDLVQSFERTYSQDLFRAGDGCHREWLARRARAVGAWKGVVDAVNPRHRVWLDLERRLFSDTRLKRVIAISHRVRRDILTHYDYPEENIRVIYNGVDRRRFHAGLRNEYRSRVREELGLEPDEPVALFIGSGFARKGLREAVGALARGRFRLLAAGRDRIGPYERLARRLGVGERLVYLGPRQDVPRLVRRRRHFCFARLVRTLRQRNSRGPGLGPSRGDHPGHRRSGSGRRGH